METSTDAGSGRRRRSRIRAQTIETALIVALAGLVFLLGARVLGGIAVAVGEMTMALARL